ncbi:MAG: hypothetical protein Q9170_004588 [Blastenia crenularia]
MPTDNRLMIALIREIGKALVEKAERLAIAAREPDENVHFQATQTAQNAAVRTAIKMGVFDEVPLRGSSSVSALELSTALKVDEALLGYPNPTDYHHSAFQYAHRTDLGFWEFLNEDPESKMVFDSGMRSSATIGSSAAGAYPFGRELEAVDIDAEDVVVVDVVVVDVGALRGQALEAIKAAYPSLKGRLVLQDTRDVIEEAKAR